jgi:ribosomal protein L21E
MQQMKKRTFSVGDKVTFTLTRESGRSVRISVKEATVVELMGDIATVKYRNGQRVRLHIDRLTHEGEPNALTKALLRGL